MSMKEIKPKKKAEEGQTISMDAWISLRMAQDKKLRPTQRREIEVFLRKQGLGGEEKPERYEEAFAKF